MVLHPGQAALVDIFECRDGMPTARWRNGEAGRVLLDNRVAVAHPDRMLSRANPMCSVPG